MLAPADEISGEVIIGYSKEWIKQVYHNTGKEFGDTYGDHTGKLLYKVNDDFKNSRDSSFDYNGWKVTLVKTTNKVTGEFQTKLKVKGNPSAIFYGGKNYRNILFEDFKAILLGFAEAFLINVGEIRLTIPYEPSATVVFDPKEFLFNKDAIEGKLMCFQDKGFDIMRNKIGSFMGYEANNAHYTQKIYLPAVKFNEPLNSLRIESSYNRVKTFKERTGIETWGDLITDEAMYRCYNVVLQGWDDIIVCDHKLRRNKKYPDYLNEMIKKGKSPKYWLTEFPLTASDKTLKKRIEEYRLLSFQKGDGLHTKVRNWITNEAEHFRNLTTRLTGNILEYSRYKMIEDRLIKNTKDMDQGINTGSKELINAAPKLSKKQLEKRKREQKRNQYTAFLRALDTTLQKIESKAA